MSEDEEAVVRYSGQGDAELLVALRHELRRRILRAMFDEEAEKISPRHLAHLLKEPLSNVSYHVRILADCGAIELVDTQPVRGSMQHFYSSAIEEPWALAALGLDPSHGGEAPSSPSADQPEEV